MPVPVSQLVMDEPLEPAQALLIVREVAQRMVTVRPHGVSCAPHLVRIDSLAGVRCTTTPQSRAPVRGLVSLLRQLTGDSDDPTLLTLFFSAHEMPDQAVEGFLVLVDRALRDVPQASLSSLAARVRAARTPVARAEGLSETAYWELPEDEDEPEAAAEEEPPAELDGWLRDVVDRADPVESLRPANPRFSTPRTAPPPVVRTPSSAEPVRNAQPDWRAWTGHAWTAFWVLFTVAWIGGVVAVVGGLFLALMG